MGLIRCKRYAMHDGNYYELCLILSYILNGEQNIIQDNRFPTACNEVTCCWSYSNC